MKCPMCGKDTLNDLVVHEVTNEEYIRQCSTEELAIFLCNELQDDEVGTLANRFERELYSEYPIRPMNAYHEVMRWLKEKHNE